MKLTPLSNEEAARSGFTIKAAIVFADLVAGSAVNFITLDAATAPPNFGWVVRLLAVRLITASNAATTGTLSVGDTASGTQYLTTVDIKGGVPGSTGYFLAAASTNKVYTAATQKLTFTYAETGAASTTGAFDIYVGLFQLDKLADVLPGTN
jgi:hypothetical protein